MMDPSTSSGPDPVYQVFTDLNDHFWINKTVLAKGRLGKEFPKTAGHYHQVKVDEKYYVAQGKGVLVLQTADKVWLVKAGAGDEVIIKPEFGHSWSNVGEDELVLFDNWSVPHSPADYAPVLKNHGLAYYLVDENGEVKAVPNQNYQNPPKPRWLTAAEFKRYSDSGR